MFQEAGSALQIDIEELFEVSVHDVKKYPYLEKTFSYRNEKYFESGRNAIEYIFKYCIDSKNKKVLLPEYLCTSISDAVTRAGWDFQFYKIDKRLKIQEDDLLNKIKNNSVLFVIDYFGKNQSFEFLEKIKRIYPEIIIIEDCTQSLLSERNEIDIVDYLIASIRKWFPIPSGGGVWSHHTLPDIQLTKGISEYSYYYFVSQLMKTEYLRNPALDKEKYLEWMNKGVKKLFEDYSIRDMDQISKTLLLKTDWESIKKRRRNNYDILSEQIKNNTLLECISKLKEGEIPFCFPVCTEHREELLKYLIKNNIYCNVHWRLDIEKSNISQDIQKVSNSILSIPCDQRYTEEEMKHIGKVLNDWKVK